MELYSLQFEGGTIAVIAPDLGAASEKAQLLLAKRGLENEIQSAVVIDGLLSVDGTNVVFLPPKSNSKEKVNDR